MKDLARSAGLCAIGITLGIIASIRCPVVPAGAFAYVQSNDIFVRLCWWWFPVMTMTWIVTMRGICPLRQRDLHSYVRLAGLLGAWLTVRTLVLWPMVHILTSILYHLPPASVHGVDWRRLLLMPSEHVSITNTALAWVCGVVSVAAMWLVTRVLCGIENKRQAATVLILMVLNTIAVQLSVVFRSPFLMYVVWSILRIGIVWVWELWCGSFRVPAVQNASRT